ncbi:MAG: hypothetical protein P8Y23_10195, partial [Candidatus Lokiarchaeota archaeon]
MIIGYIYNFHAYPPKGGGHRHAYELAQGFIENGHEVYVLNDFTMPGARCITCENIDELLEKIDVLYVRIDGVPLNQRECVGDILDKSAKIPTVWEINAPADEALAFSWLGGKVSTRKENILIRLKRWIHAARKMPAIKREIRI